MLTAQATAPAATPARFSKRRTRLIAAVVLAAAAIFDWSRPPREQWSVHIYNFGVVGGYRHVVHPVTGKITRCRFHPTCSRYSEEAMNTYGFPKGFVLTLWRLARCAPGTKAGTYDPVGG